jgi:hypothetical protein
MAHGQQFNFTNTGQGVGFGTNVASNSAGFVVVTSQNDTTSNLYVQVYLCSNSSCSRVCAIPTFSGSPSAEFGKVVVISDTGLLAISAHADSPGGSVYLYSVNSSACTPFSTHLFSLDTNDFGVALAVDGDVVVIYAINSTDSNSTLFLYTCSNSTMSCDAYIYSPISLNSQGTSSSLSVQNGTLYLSLPDYGSNSDGGLFVFSFDVGGYTEFIGSPFVYGIGISDRFGGWLSVCGKYVVMGSKDFNGGTGGALGYSCGGSTCSLLPGGPVTPPSGFPLSGFFGDLVCRNGQLIIGFFDSSNDGVLVLHNISDSGISYTGLIATHLGSGELLGAGMAYLPFALVTGAPNFTPASRKRGGVSGPGIVYIYSLCGPTLCSAITACGSTLCSVNQICVASACQCMGPTTVTVTATPTPTPTTTASCSSIKNQFNALGCCPGG